MERKFIVGVLMTTGIVIIMFFFYIRALNYEKSVEAEKKMDSLIGTLNNKINETSNIALSLSLALSKNPYIIQCLLKGNDDACSNYIPDFEAIMEKNKVFKNMTMHLHVSDHSSFVCLNHQKTAEVGSAFVRNSLKKARDTKEPAQGMEIGQYGIFKRVVVPIFEKDNYMGAIETIVFPEEYTEFFKHIGVDFYILMKNSYLPTDSGSKDTEKLMLKNYTITNQETNGLNFLNDIEFSGTGYLKHDDKYIVYTPIIDVNGDEIGYYVLSWIEEN
jgi:hypothetical protein